MSLFLEYQFPPSREVVFPDLCIGCGVSHPETTITFGTNQVGWWTYILWTFGRRFRVHVPACSRCRRQLTIRIWIHRLVLGATAIIGVWTAGYLFADWKRSLLKRLAMMGIGLGVMVPADVAICHWLPLPLDLTFDSGTVTYEFNDLNYAIEFAKANGEWPEEDDEPEAEFDDEYEEQDDENDLEEKNQETDRRWDN